VTVTATAASSSSTACCLTLRRDLAFTMPANHCLECWWRRHDGSRAMEHALQLQAVTGQAHSLSCGMQQRLASLLRH
jgi:hypothetical protein